MGKHAVLVTGDRDWDDAAFVRSVLNQYCTKDTVVIHGNARGVDRAADDACLSLGLRVVRVPYHGHLGRAGGQARNSLMLTILLGFRLQDYYVEVFAIHDDLGRSVGTKGMIDKARKKDVKVRHFKHRGA